MSGEQVYEDLTILLLFWCLTWLSAQLADRTRLSPLVYYLVFGCIVGNLRIWDLSHSFFLESFGEFAIMVVFFALGFEETPMHFMEGLRKAWGIAFIGALVPFLCGFGCSFLFWPSVDPKTALMGGLAVTATAVSLTMIALKSEGLATSKPAIGIMTSAVLDDIASLALVAICVPIATGEAEPTPAGVAWMFGKAAMFFLVVIISHVCIFPKFPDGGPKRFIPGLRSVGLQDVLQIADGEHATLTSLTEGLFFAMVAVWLGFHPAIGAYMGGLVLEEHYFDVETGNTFQSTLHQLECAAFEWLGPIFFIKLGSTIIVDLDILKDVLPYTLVFYVVMVVGQFTSAAFAARYVPGGFTWAESCMIGLGMLGRAELFFVVLDVCYNQNNIMNKEQFFTFAFTAMLLNVTVPVSIALYKPHYMKAKAINKLTGLNGKRTSTRSELSEMDEDDDEDVGLYVEEFSKNRDGSMTHEEDTGCPSEDFSTSHEFSHHDVGEPDLHHDHSRHDQCPGAWLEQPTGQNSDETVITDIVDQEHNIGPRKAASVNDDDHLH